MRFLVLTTSVAALLAPAAPAAAADVVPVRAERPFVLLAERGDATTWTLHPTAPGTVSAVATWSGGERLTLALERPGEGGHLARESGTSPLALRFRLTPELLRLDGEWRLTLLNFSGRLVRGEVVVTWPGERAASRHTAVPQERATAAAVLGRSGTRAASRADVAAPPVTEPLPPQPEGSGEVRRTVLPDGRVRIDHPDGSAVIYGPGSFTRIAPDGTETTFSFRSQVQEATLPPPPGDPAFQGFLGAHEDLLLRQIRFLVDQEEQAVANYLAHEATETATVVERIDLRRHYVDVLLGLGP